MTLPIVRTKKIGGIQPTGTSSLRYAIIISRGIHEAMFQTQHTCCHRPTDTAAQYIQMYPPRFKLFALIIPSFPTPIASCFPLPSHLRDKPSCRLDPWLVRPRGSPCACSHPVLDVCFRPSVPAWYALGVVFVSCSFLLYSFAFVSQWTPTFRQAKSNRRQKGIHKRECHEKPNR